MTHPVPPRGLRRARQLRRHRCRRFRRRPRLLELAQQNLLLALRQLELGHQLLYRLGLLLGRGELLLFAKDE